jgi:hypothetical protein
MQSRIVLRDSVLERGEELLRATKLGSLTELINVMFRQIWRTSGTNLGSKADVPSLTQPEVSPQTGQSEVLPEPDFRFDEPITGL